MNRDRSGLKDSGAYTDISLKDSYFPISYNKTNKLITALYMVTDILDKEEPLRNKLRTLGADIISDIHSAPARVRERVQAIMSFLDIAMDMNLISEMNVNILRKEFGELDSSVAAAMNERGLLRKPVNIAEFLAEEIEAPEIRPSLYAGGSVPGHNSTRLGVQKGSTLLKALSDVERKSLKDTSHKISASGSEESNRTSAAREAHASEVLKAQRRNDIILLIKSVGGAATIKDIKDKSAHLPSLNSCSDKTIQRELVSMVKDNVLNKTGDKRWSKYGLKN